MSNRWNSFSMNRDPISMKLFLEASGLRLHENLDQLNQAILHALVSHAVFAEAPLVELPMDQILDGRISELPKDYPAEQKTITAIQDLKSALPGEAIVRAISFQGCILLVASVVAFEMTCRRFYTLHRRQ